MRVLGLMSGTSADGIDVALVRVIGRGRNLRARLERFRTVPSPPPPPATPQPARERFAGRRIASTMQLGEAQVLAERTGIPVVADFRPRDLAAGGQGAPLVPFVDYLLYRHPRRGRVALNIGGIANMTIIPAGAKPEEGYAFDTGPG